jgi:hypothetical protein
MDPKIYDRLWDKTFEAYDPDILRTRRHKHPIIVAWLKEDARRGHDPEVNPLYFIYRPHFRSPVRRRGLRIFNTLLWTLNSEGFSLERHQKDVIVGHKWHRTKLSIREGTDTPQRATSPSWRKPSGQLICQIEARLPAGIENRWVDEPSIALEARIPDIMASFAVWALERKHNGPK